MQDREAKLAAMRAYYQRHKEKLKARSRTHYQANKATRKIRDKDYYEANKPHIHAVTKIWRTKNAAAIKVSKHLSYEAQKAADPDFLALCRTRNRRSYQSTRMRRLKRCAEWARTHPDSKHASRIRRRMRLLAVQVSIEKVDREAIIKRDKSICHICHKRVARKDLTLDHLIPLFHGGPDTAANLAVAHRSCNASRGTGRIAAQLRLFG